MNESPVPAYKILIAEHNAQSKVRLSDDDVDALLKRVTEQFADISDTHERATKIHDAMLSEFFGWLRRNKIRRTALCLSGGGIRSGTFALGLLQGLARHRLLGQFDFWFSGRYERLLENASTAAGTLMPNTKGDIAVGQFGLNIPIKSLGMKFPVSVTFANRTELIKEKEVRGNIGFTLNWDTLFSKLKPF